MDPLQGDEFEERCDILLRKTDMKNLLIPRKESGTGVEINFAEDGKKYERRFKRARVRVRVRRHGKDVSMCCFSVGRTATKLGEFLSSDTFGKVKNQSDTSSEVDNKMNHSFHRYYHLMQNHRKIIPLGDPPLRDGKLSQFDDSQQKGKKKAAAFKGLLDQHLEEKLVNPHKEKKKKQKWRHDSPKGGKLSTIADCLATQVKNYANCTYLLGRKKCYNCFMATQGGNTEEDIPSKGVSINDYGFYSKKGKYHDNEDTCSHASFSSYEIQKEVEHVIHLMGSRKMKFSLFDEVLKMFCKRSLILRNRDDSPRETKLGRHRNELYPPSKRSNGGTCKVYLKPVLPLYHLEGGNPSIGPHHYDMICRYFYEERSRDNKEGNRITQKRERKKNMHKDTHDVEKGNKKLQLECLTQWREKAHMLDDQGEEFYQTHNPNLRFSHYYKFFCKTNITT
ncbi:hypothetical protein PCYB_114120 [Plasmodium cynomolgi strain B]|uniref:Uncharacterized protein n=1 Tax=Plasmodium cynomolgi (strain B) TaxID=1120755 RepID=K6VDR7_PLACD|nr:hypothetical protein PCYB_114120 [Plasmodium cynomolgi strain B]GAB67392.1 hypothetical protein PCYB_114120 [Plasmodium cynomolgi strain B]